MGLFGGIDDAFASTLDHAEILVCTFNTPVHERKCC